MKQYLLYIVAIVVLFTGCKKYLDKKSEDDFLTFDSISDIQGLLDNTTQINIFQYTAAEVLSDDYYLTASDWTALSSQGSSGPLQKNLYIWQKDDNTIIYWSSLYQRVSYTNIALDELADMDYNLDQQADYNNVKGSALFLRSFYFYHLAQLFAKPYTDATAQTDLGIVLPLHFDLNGVSVRSLVSETYNRIITDLKLAILLLPEKPSNIGLPSQIAAYGMLARTYLSMNKYDSAGRYANLGLSLYDSLMNYNDLNASANAPIPKYNKEIIFFAKASAITTFTGTRAKIDSNLYNSYSDNDLRKTVFFRPNTGSNVGTYAFKGDYDGIGNPINTFYAFIGIVTDEMYLIKAECLARNNNTDLAMGVLNDLLVTRYETSTFNPLTASTSNEALTIILNERRKELLRRGARWTDIKRLMDDPNFRILPERLINNQVYPMTVTNIPYIMLLPKEVIELGGIPQN